MSFTLFKTVQFPPSYTGLASYVTYTVNGARSNTGVSELDPTHFPGLYGAAIPFPNGYSSWLGWDTGTAPGVTYLTAVEDGIVDPRTILDGVVTEAGVNGRQALALILDALMAKLSGVPNGNQSGTITIRDVNDSADRILVGVDGRGNRTSVTLTPPA